VYKQHWRETYNVGGQATGMLTMERKNERNTDKREPIKSASTLYQNSSESSGKELQRRLKKPGEGKRIC